MYSLSTWKKSHFVCIYGKFQFPIFHYPLPVSLPSSLPLFCFSCPKNNFLQSHHLIMIYGCECSTSQDFKNQKHVLAPERKLYYHRFGSSSQLFKAERKSIFTLNIVGGLKRTKIRAICPGKLSSKKTKNQFFKSINVKNP